MILDFLVQSMMKKILVFSLTLIVLISLFPFPPSYSGDAYETITLTINPYSSEFFNVNLTLGTDSTLCTIQTFFDETEGMYNMFFSLEGSLLGSRYNVTEANMFYYIGTGLYSVRYDNLTPEILELVCLVYRDELSERDEGGFYFEFTDNVVWQKQVKHGELTKISVKDIGEGNHRFSLGIADSNGSIVFHLLYSDTTLDLNWRTTVNLTSTISEFGSIEANLNEFNELVVLETNDGLEHNVVIFLSLDLTKPFQIRDLIIGLVLVFALIMLIRISTSKRRKRTDRPYEYSAKEIQDQTFLAARSVDPRMMSGGPYIPIISQKNTRRKKKSKKN